MNISRLVIDILIVVVIVLMTMVVLNYYYPIEQVITFKTATDVYIFVGTWLFSLITGFVVSRILESLKII